MFQQLGNINFYDVLSHNCDVSSKLSPKGDHYASALQRQLQVRRVLDQELLHTFICDSTVESFEWSPDSELIFCCMKRGFAIQVWSVINSTWKWKLDESPLSIIDVLWAPDSRTLLVTYEFHIKVKIWSLVSTQTTVVEDVKPIDNYVSFSSTCDYMAIAIRPEYKDLISVYTLTWMPLKTFPVETKNLTGIFFSPSDLVIAVLEGHTEEFKVLFYSIDGRLLSKYEKPSHFDVTSLSWHKNGKYISFGNFSGEISILHGSQYQEIASYQHLETINTEDIVVYKITDAMSERNNLVSNESPCNLHLNKVEKTRPVVVPTVAATSEKNKLKHIKCGIPILEHSSDGQYIASISGESPDVIYIYDMKIGRICSIIIHHQKIKSISWHSKKTILAFSSGCSTLDMWTPSSCITCISPFKEEFSVNNVQFSSCKDSLMLNGKEKSTILNLP